MSSKLITTIFSFASIFLFCSQTEIKQNDNICTDTSKSNRYIYLTFDDGPLNGSQNINEVALSEQIKINVFVVGMYMEHSKILQEYFKLYEENPFIEIYNHSFSHANENYNSYYKNVQGVLDDILKNEMEYKLNYKIVRLPGRNMWRIGNRKRDDINSGSEAADSLASIGYKLFGWDIQWEHDLENGDPIQSADEMLNKIDYLFDHDKSFTSGHVVVLMHDEMFKKNWEETELRTLVQKIKLKGNYSFEHVKDYPSE